MPVTYGVAGRHQPCWRPEPCNILPGWDRLVAGKEPYLQHLSDQRGLPPRKTYGIVRSKEITHGNYAVRVLSDSIRRNYETAILYLFRNSRFPASPIYLIISYKSVPLNQLHHYYILYNLSMKEDRTKEAGKEILLLILFFWPKDLQVSNNCSTFAV